MCIRDRIYTSNQNVLYVNMRAHASIFSANKYFQIKVLNPYRVFVDRYERDSVVVGIVGMCITGCLIELSMIP